MTGAAELLAKLCSPVRAGASSVLLLLSLAGCGGAPTQTQAPEPADANAAADTNTDEGRDDRVACAPGGAARLQRVCQVERSQTDRGLVLTIRHPDGGFRKLLVVEDGRGLLAADGAEPARVELTDQDEIDVTIGNDQYRLPATRRAGAP